jgi:hypothetical protein
MSKKRNLALTVIRKGRRVAELTVEADPDDFGHLRQLLLDAVQRDGRTERSLGEYEMQVRLQKDPRLITTFVASTDS